MDVTKQGRSFQKVGAFHATDEGKYPLDALAVETVFDKGEKELEKAILGFQKIKIIEADDGLDTKASKPLVLLFVKLEQGVVVS